MIRLRFTIEVPTTQYPPTKTYTKETTRAGYESIIKVWLFDLMSDGNITPNEAKIMVELSDFMASANEIKLILNDKTIFKIEEFKEGNNG